MAGFTDSALTKKLDDLNASQQSIQTLSLWLIHHRKHHEVIVKMWIKELQKGDEGRQLTLMYLANDVIQNSKKKGPEYGKEFGTVLKKAFQIVQEKVLSEKTRKSMTRLLDVWEERGVYSRSQIVEFRRAFKNEVEEEAAPPPKKKPRTSNGVPKLKKEKQVEVEVDGRKEKRITLSPQLETAGDPPEPEELIKALQDLEVSPSCDAVVREKIARLPPEVSEVGLLAKLEDKGAAERLAVQVNDAISLLAEYNSRLAVEMDERKRLTQMMRDFLQAQRELLAQAETTLEENQEKLAKVRHVQHEVRSHMRNLPDITQNATGGLAPLPSAGDLFRLK